MVGGLLIAVKAIREWRGRPFTLTFLSGEGVDAVLWNRTAFLAVLTFAFAPFICRTLCGMNSGNKIRGRGWRTVREKVVLDPGPSPSMYQVSFDQE
jgi:hypothetical protein